MHILVMESITAVIADFRTLFGMDLAMPALTVKEHKAILRAIRRREERLAAELLEHHLLRVDERHRKLMSKKEAQEMREPAAPAGRQKGRQRDGRKR